LIEGIQEYTGVLMLQKFYGKSKSEQEWHKAGEKIAKLVEQMPALKELT
jgi:hypothetical protein